MINSLIKKKVPKWMLAWYHMTMPFLGALIYRFPSKKIKVIGITGTNGKTTTAELTALALKGAGYKIGLLSSVRFEIAGKSRPNLLKMTMPGRMIIQKILREAVDAKCDYMVLEVTSEGIKQFRHLFINFEVALITNLSPEHIESHGGFENYKKAKSELFKITLKNHILNLDDEHFNYFFKFSAQRKIGYGTKTSRKGIESIIANNCSVNFSGINFTVDKVNFHLNLLGEFNIYNALAAISIAKSQGIELDVIRNSWKELQVVEGRMEEVISNPFRVFVDYAFTPNALNKVYQTIKNDFFPSKMICVLGACGGGRDKWKRSVLGEIAAKYCDRVIITNEDPYDEDPLEIMEQVARGAGKKGEIITDRKEAIFKSIKEARNGDVVIITGKGSEPWMCVSNNKKIPWDDRKIVEEEFYKIKNGIV